MELKIDCNCATDMDDLLHHILATRREIGELKELLEGFEQLKNHKKIMQEMADARRECPSSLKLDIPGQ